ncbi:MAG: hypothetical protein RLZZ303_165 [Candidatus Hydrogenedentota bacterium]|jgi:hypothetical protein
MKRLAQTIMSSLAIGLAAWGWVGLATADTSDPAGNTLRGYLAFPLVQRSLDPAGNQLEGIVPGAFALGSLDGNGHALGTAALLDEGESTGEEGEGAAEGEGEGLVEGEGEGTPEGEEEGLVEGEGQFVDVFEELLYTFASADVDADRTVTLEEIQAQLPGFTQEDLDEADANDDGALSVPELLAVSTRPVIHSADTNGDYALSLSELLRVVQLYNAGGYACADNPGATEDGYLPQSIPGPPECLPHALDANSDNQISLSELLRGIQLFSFAGYTYCEGQSEDSFCDRL